MKNKQLLQTAWNIIRAHDMVLDWDVAKKISSAARRLHHTHMSPMAVMIWASEQKGTKTL
jgi:hypothetical protein